MKVSLESVLVTVLGVAPDVADYIATLVKAHRANSEDGKALSKREKAELRKKAKAILGELAD